MDKQERNPKPEKDYANTVIPLSAGAGVALGAGIGTAFGDIAIGAGIGTALGAAVGTALVMLRGRNGSKK